MPAAGAEHSHRAAGYLVGCCVIILACGLWRSETRRWVRWLGMAALAGVVVQGLLGGFRVKLNKDPELVNLIRTRFVPVAVDHEVERRKDAEGDLYRK